MKRTRGTAVLIAGTAIVLALLAGFAIELSASQAKSRRSLETQAHQRAELVSGLTEAVFQQVAHVGPQESATLGTRVVPDRALQRYKGNDAYVAVADSRGAIIAHSSGFGAQARHAVVSGSALRLIRHGDPWALGDITSSGHARIIDFATRLATPRGERIIVSGLPLQTLSAFTLLELRKVPGVRDQHLYLLDSRGVVIASTNAQRLPGYAFHTPAQLRTLSHGSGVISSTTGQRYFDQVPLANTTWKLILSAPAGEFFASVVGLHHWLPWFILAAFGVMALVALVLVARAIQSAERIRVANQRLTESNAELAGAQASLERSNSELERQAQELVRSNSELDQFASIASHDLQEPLRKVRTFTERVSDTEAANLSERGADYLRRANASAERMQVLIEDLLRFSRVTTQVRPFAPVDLAAVAADVLDDLSEQVRRVGARVEISTLATINADAPQMRQLLQNLISNALKFRREDVAPVVRVGAEAQAGWLRLTVADNGIGFEPQYAQRIFRVFERLHGRGAYPGTGIGLALCRKIAERHGGTVVATSAPGEGATFTVTLQTERTEAVSATPPPSGQAGSGDREEPYVAA